MKGSRFLASVVLLAWQAAPLQIEPDSAGRVRLSLGYGQGRSVARTFSCSGELLSAEPVTDRTVGASIDAWPSRRLRVSAAGAYTASNPRTLTTYHAVLRGASGGVVIAREGQRFGIGVGVARIPEQAGPRTGFTAPSFYLRAGNIDKVHFELNVLQPSASSEASSVNLGIGWNRGHLRGLGGVAGWSTGPVTYTEGSGGRLFGEVWFPLRGAADLTFNGALGGSAEWSAGAGVRLHLAR